MRRRLLATTLKSSAIGLGMFYLYYIFESARIINHRGGDTNEIIGSGFVVLLPILIFVWLGILGGGTPEPAAVTTAAIVTGYLFCLLFLSSDPLVKRLLIFSIVGAVFYPIPYGVLSACMEDRGYNELYGHHDGVPKKFLQQFLLLQFLIITAATIWIITHFVAIARSQ